MNLIKYAIGGFILLFFSGNISAQTIQPEHLSNLNIRSIGPAAMSGRVTALAADPSNYNVIYAGAASGGLWRSQNAGLTWIPIFDKAPTQSIGSVAVSPRNPDEIWVGTGEGNPRNSQNFGMGVFKTIDGGKNWQHLGLENTKTIHRVILHRDLPDVAWVAAMGSTNGANPERGVFKTTDGGKNWRKVLFVNDLTGCAELVVDPKNPNKLIAAMWEYQRWPWKFKSGGVGSGIYISHDGGETWARRTEKDGLPEGELGRCGLAISPANSSVVYALVEAKENALYKSTDGGLNWKKMATKGMGDRPFYYGEIYADPKDENTVYSIFTVISRSIDGGKTFDTFAGWEIHVDHHALWIHPENPDLIIDGNDGGLNITRDGGKTWHFSENLPLGQFYHVRLDNDTPYNIYGGLQDNGTWVGPSSVWKQGGIRNSDWQELYFGDGFDALPHPRDNRYIYCMSQGGELSLVDRKTGDNRYIKPIHPEQIPLRFHWNAAIEADPFNPDGVYFGSQFLHHSENKGASWNLLSPDLTNNDTLKISESKKTGGLTPDVTAAENHCTILAIAPSPVQRGVIWVGTDDGNLQLTTDGGKNWTNFAGKIKGFPTGGWIPQIEVSQKNAGEVFVVVNNYRQNDWQPYLFHTKDFGKNWTRLADAKNVQGFSLSVVQDPEVPELLFLGTDQGLHFSIDYGKTWTHWAKESFPSCPVQDMKIHEREGDLVIATFGRAIWILDNLSPLRALARTQGNLLKRDFVALPPQPAYLASWRSYDGTRFTGSGIYSGANKGSGARIPIWVHPRNFQTTHSAEKPGKKEKTSADENERKGKEDKKKKATAYILNMAGDTLCTMQPTLDSCFNYLTWSLYEKGERMPSNDAPPKDAGSSWGGPQVPAGNYLFKIKYGDWQDSTIIKVLPDPRLDYSPEEKLAKANAIRDLNKKIARATKTYNRLLEMGKTMKLVDENLSAVPDSLKKEFNDLAKPLRDSIENIKASFFQQKELKGIQRSSEVLNSKFWRARSYINGEKGAPGATTQLAFQNIEQAVEDLVTRVNQLTDKQWLEYQKAVESIPTQLFKKYERL